MAATEEDIKLLWKKSEREAPPTWLERNGKVLLVGVCHQQETDTYHLVRDAAQATNFSVWYVESRANALIMYSSTDQALARRVFDLCSTIVYT